MVVTPHLSPAVIATALSIAVSSAVSAAAAQDLSRLDSVIPAMMQRRDVPGVALVVVRGDKVIALEGYGISRIRDSARVDPERSIFRLASVSKLFVATAAMQQRERGLLDFNADVNRYLEWQVAPTWPEPITVERLLTHTAGFDERMIGYGAPSADSVGPLGEHVRSNLPNRGWRPGTVLGYSNYGFSLAAHVVERTAGQPFDAYARGQIFVPLGMRRTHYIAVPDSLRPDLAEGHFCGDGRCRVAPVVYSRPFAAGFAYSTARDMGQFLIAMLGGHGATTSGRALRQASVDTMQMQHWTASAAVSGISYAFFNQQHRGHRLLAHAGNVPGFNNLLVLAPESGVGFYFVANGGRSAFGAELRDSLLAMLLPARADTRPAAITLDERRLKELAGHYQLTRSAHRTIEKFPALFSTAATVVASGGKLALLGAEYEPIDSSTFRLVNGDAIMAFRQDSATGKRMLLVPINAYGAELPGTAEQLAWHDGAWFMNEYVSYLVMLPLIVAFIAWPLAAGIAAWRRRRRGEPAARQPQSIWLLAGMTTFALLWTWYGFGFVARSVRQLSSGEGLVLGVSPQMRAMSMLAWLLAALAFAMVAGAIVAWRRGWWDVPRRGLISLYAVLSLLVVSFLVRWNYLPPVF